MKMDRIEARDRAIELAAQMSELAALIQHDLEQDAFGPGEWGGAAGANRQADSFKTDASVLAELIAIAYPR